MASGALPPPSPTVAVAVRPGGSASRRAARWAAASLLQDDGAGRAAAIAFVHVIPPLSFVPSPTGERVPVARVGRDAAKAYSHDRHARVQEALLPFRRLCGRRAYANVETVVVEGDDVAEALLRYGAESGVRSLVLGSVSFRWFQRVLSIPDVPTAVLKNTQNLCNVFVVCKRTIIVKVSGYPQASKSSSNLRIQSISHEVFVQKKMGLLFENVTEAESRSVSCSQARCSRSAFSDDSTRPESGALVHVGNGSARTKGRDLNKNYSSHSSLKENSSDECQSVDEVEKLRKELKETVVMYDKACEDLVHAKKKVKFLQQTVVP
ncbi:hypothetical protein ACQ4PT_019083 [Festuca glaucescens]